MTPLPLTEWRDFYLMIGSASGVIVGATFVVITLSAGMKERMLGLSGFITPTAVHLGSVLVASAILTMPTLSLLSLAILLGVGGIVGAAYGVVVARRIWAMKLALDDRFFYIILPILSYIALAAAAFLAYRSVEHTFETLAIALIALLVIGMRNAWDMATFMITRDRAD